MAILHSEISHVCVCQEEKFWNYTAVNAGGVMESEKHLHASPHFVISWQQANGAASGKTVAYNLSHEQEYCGNLVINSVTQHILPSYRLSRPRPRDCRFVIYSFIVGTRVSSFVCNELHSWLCLFQLAHLCKSRPVICLWPVSTNNVS